jgi:acetate kinase
VSDDRLVLTVNPGSSSLKAALYGADRALSLEVERLGTADGMMTTVEGEQLSQQAFSGDAGAAVDELGAVLSARGLPPSIVSHRVVHGGPEHHRPTVVDEQLLDDLRAAVPLAPLHLPAGIEVIGHARRVWPGAVQVACFDTGFHHDLPPVARRLPVPAEVVELGVRRYGFHGLSIQSVLHQHPDLGGAVIAHLGSGCSVSAVADGRPRYTTMSLTPTSGMISGTRAGDLDPELGLFLIEQHGYTPDRLRDLFDHRSGIAGISGGPHDVRDLLESADEAAGLALDAFCASAARSIAACASALDRWDSLVFTGGVGEHAHHLRERICRRLLPVRGLVAGDGGGDEALGATGLRVLVVTADEQGQLDRLARALVPA